MIAGSKLRNADVLISTAFIVLGVAIIVSALRMPWGGESDQVRAWYASPGLFPLVLGGLLILFSLSVLANAIRQGGHHRLARSCMESLSGAVKNPVAHRVVVMWLLLAGYVFGLTKVFGYYTGSIAFLLVFMLYVHRRADGGRKRLWDYSLIAVVSVVVPVSLGLVFERVFYTPMP